MGYCRNRRLCAATGQTATDTEGRTASSGKIVRHRSVAMPALLLRYSLIAERGIATYRMEGSIPNVLNRNPGGQHAVDCVLRDRLFCRAQAVCSCGGRARVAGVAGSADGAVGLYR